MESPRYPEEKDKRGKPNDKKPRISAVVCAYNRSRLLKMALESLKEQTPSKAEYKIIVVNNRSSDNIAAIVK